MRSQVLHSMELPLPSLVYACARRFRPAARRKPVVLTAASTITTSRSLTAVIWVTLRCGLIVSLIFCWTPGSYHGFDRAEEGAILVLGFSP